MSDEQRLTFAFLDRQPAAAAEVLQELDSADAAAFLAAAPARLAGPVLEQMAPWAAASALEGLAAEKSAAVIQAMRTQAGASILRLLPDAYREDVMEQLPRTAARALGASLSYPRDSVGSWMDQKVPSFPESTKVGEVMRYLRTRRRRSAPALYVVGPGRQFLGVVDLGELLKTNETAALSEIVDRSVSPISNRARLSSIVSEPDWDRFNALPVVGRRQNFLGALSREQLRAGLTEGRAQAARAESITLLSQLASAYVTTCVGLTQTVAGSATLQPARPAKEMSHGR